MPSEYLRLAQCRYTFASMTGTLRARAGLVWVVTLVPPQNPSLSSFVLTFKFQSTIIRIKNLQKSGRGPFFRGLTMRRSFAASTVLCLLLSLTAFSQSENATVGGTVQDSTGAFIPGVSVTATNTATGVVTTVVSNEAGAYQFASLQPGTYDLKAELPGFQTASTKAFQLGGAQQARLNFTLQVGAAAGTTVEVNVAADTLLATSSNSVGAILPEYKVRDLPLAVRDVFGLVAATPGTQGSGDQMIGNFAGGRLSAANTVRDGINVSAGRFEDGAWSLTYTSPDLVEEVKVVVAPVDAQTARGSGQVSMVTRSGTNQFRGSVFWTNHNSALDASNWFNNFNGVKKDYNNRNQFGARVGGPVIKNKTFFFVLVDEQRDMIKQTTVGTVLTPLARQGIFRFFPGVDNQNVTQNNPTVDRNGNPVKPANATGDLQQFSVFTNNNGTARDPNRPGYDPSGYIPNVLLARMPLPNDYTVGDGLNTAGIRFTRSIYGLDSDVGNGTDLNRDQVNFRGDHNFSANHKFSVTYTYENDCCHTASSGLPSWPGGYSGEAGRTPRVLTASLVSTLSPTIVNELRVGYKRSALFGQAPFYVGRNPDGTGSPTGAGSEAFKTLPVSNGIPYEPVTTLFVNNFINGTLPGNRTRGAISPLYSYGDTLSFTKGKHALKTGAELRFGHSDGWNDVFFVPQVFLGAGGIPVANID